MFYYESLHYTNVAIFHLFQASSSFTGAHEVRMEYDIAVDIGSMNKTLKLNDTEEINWIEPANVEGRGNMTFDYSVLRKGIYRACNADPKKISILDSETVEVEFFHPLNDDR